MAGTVSDLHFELNSPDPTKWKEPYMRPKPHTYLLREVLADINRIIRNYEHDQVHEIHRSWITFRRTRCCIWTCLPWLIVLSALWAAYIWYLCEEYFELPTDHCLPLDYTDSMFNLVCWGLFVLSLIVTTMLCIFANCRYSRSTQRIAIEWRKAVKKEIEDNIAIRRQQSPQMDFNISYSQRLALDVLSGVVTIKKNGNSPVPDGHSNDSSFHIVDPQNAQNDGQQHLNVLSHFSVPSKSTDLTQLNTSSNMAAADHPVHPAQHWDWWCGARFEV